MASEANSLFAPQLSCIPVRSVMNPDVAAPLLITSAAPPAAGAALSLESMGGVTPLQLPEPSGALYLSDSQSATFDLRDALAQSTMPAMPELAAELRTSPAHTLPALNGNGHSAAWMIPASDLVDQVMGPLKELRVEALPILHAASPITGGTDVSFEFSFVSTYRGLPLHDDVFACFLNPVSPQAISFDAAPMAWAQRSLGVTVSETLARIIPINRAAIAGPALQAEEGERPQFNTPVAVAAMPAPHSALQAMCEAKSCEVCAHAEISWLPPNSRLALGPLSLSSEMAKTSRAA